MLSVQSGLNILFLRIYVIQDSVSIYLVRRCKNNDLKVFISFFKTLHNIWPDIDTSVHSLLIWEINFQYDIWVLRFDIIHTMDQSFIHIKNHQLFLLVRELWRRHVHTKVLHLLWLHYSDVIFDEL